MADPIPKPNRKYTSPYLSDHLGGKIIVDCRNCGMHRQYDAGEMLERIDEDMAMPDLVIFIAIAEGCERAAVRHFDKPCGLRYDHEAMRREAK